MENSSAINKPKNRAHRSPKFPSLELPYAIEVVREARAFGREITMATLAGKNSAKSGAFIRKKASLGYYGLIAGRGDSLQITELADKILYATSDQEKKSAMQDAFLSPALYKQLYNQSEKNHPIKIDTLKNLMVRQYFIGPSAVTEFLNTFVKSGYFAGLVRYVGEGKTEIEFVPQDEMEDMIGGESMPVDKGTGIKEITEENVKPDVQVVELSLKNGQGKIIVPKTLTESDAKKLKAQIDILADLFE